MSDQTNPQTNFTAMTDQELEQVNGGWSPGKRLTSTAFKYVCMAKHCKDADKALSTLRICEGCTYTP